MVRRDVKDVSGDAGFELIARESELSQLRAFVLGATPERALVISGPAGVGKTTLWEAAISAAAAGVGVLRARAAEAETTLLFATLSDLFEHVDGDVLARIPAPQRRALDAALLRAEPTVNSEPHAIALGVLNSLRSLAADRPMLLAIDDVQWTDTASADALGFALRRSSAERIRLLVTRRTGQGTPLEAAIGRSATLELAVEGLSLGAIRHLLAIRLGLTLSRRVARQMVEATLGNPLFALEIGRLLVTKGLPGIGEALPLPGSLDDLLGARATASADARRALLAIALGGALTIAEVVALVGEGAVEAALDAGLLADDGGRLRPRHPLLATSVLKGSPLRERRTLHRALAMLASDSVRRARHLASAADGQNAGLAALVGAGAAAAAARGATELAVELAEHALRLTPSADPGRGERVLALGEYLRVAAELPRLRQLLVAELESLRPGAPRARGHLLLAEVPESQEDYDRQLAAALAQAGDADAIRAKVLAVMSTDASISWLDRLDAAEAQALEAFAIAPAGPSRLEANYAVAWVRILRGQSIDDLRPVSDGGIDDGTDLEQSLERMEGIRHAFRGRIDDARALFVRGLERALERGQEVARQAYLLQRCELELRAGQCDTAEGLIDELDGPEGSDLLGARSNVSRLRALIAALRGDMGATERWAAKAIELVIGQRWDLLEAHRAIGIAAIRAGEPARARDELLAVWSHTEAEGIEDPGAFPVAPDLVEAALAIGDSQLAATVTARLADLAHRQEHPWGLASLQRCRGLIALAAGSGDDGARADLLAAAERYDELGCRFDAARTLLALGRHARRERQWAVARDALDRAAVTFDELGCEGWAAQARDLLGRVGGRRPTPVDTLTPSERRVSELASRGMSNKEIAAALFVSVHTVEVHLAHAYPKLRVRSRAQLARALKGDPVEGPPANN